MSESSEIDICPTNKVHTSLEDGRVELLAVMKRHTTKVQDAIPRRV